MANTSTNIVVGAPSEITISAYGVAEGSGVILGATEGGVKVNFTPEFYWKTADQFMGKVDGVKTGEDMTVEIICAEVSLANIAYAFGYPTTAVSSQTLTIGGSSTVTNRTVYINGNAPGGGTCKFTIHKCVIVGATEISMVKRDKVLVKITLQVLEDTTQTANQRYFSLVYSSTDTTAPTVAMTTPVEDGNVTKETKGVVQVTFTDDDNPIDQGTLILAEADDATIMVLDLTDTTAVTVVAGSISYNSGTKVLTFTPTANWTASHKHVLIITTSVKDAAGNRLASTFEGHFTVTS